MCERKLGQVSSFHERAKVRFDKKPEGEVILPTAQIGYLCRIVNLFYPRHKLSLVKPVKKKNGIV